jgi:hypothetical protein
MSFGAILDEIQKQTATTQATVETVLAKSQVALAESIRLERRRARTSHTLGSPAQLSS